MLKVLTARMHPPKPSFQRLDGLTVLLVGASAGIGLEAAKQLATKGVETLVVTARDDLKAQKTKEAIQHHLASLSQPPTVAPNVIPLVVDMTCPKSMYEFVASLEKSVNHLDHAILSAGILLGSYEAAPTGYETSLQVNAISPTLLSLLLMPLLLASPLVEKSSVSERPHLTIVSSGAAWLTRRSDIKPFFASKKPLTELSKRENFPPGMMGGQYQYSRSKLMTEYVKRYLARLSSITDGKGKSKVLVVSVCPGAVNSSLSRHSAGSGLLGVMAKMVNNTVARTVEQGANIYMTSLELGQEARGEMWTDDHISQDHKEYVLSVDGAKFSDNVWKETKEFALRMDKDHGSGVIGRILNESL
ncbi:short-chain dehydrogenase reductase [Colletotrichum scovillei]|uniref:short-chain dehydrogenase reductase n=1 Tax=Colletotrichum scovillei TaxID=1209932 RepID=UPI0015C39F0D|nr:short-chain dehydrogenase reductase [Colletotrichum scovillei]KAF4785752.1 short-chain dehydrogenase reductase [Colletotrichum scovillei]